MMTDSKYDVALVPAPDPVRDPAQDLARSCREASPSKAIPTRFACGAGFEANDQTSCATAMTADDILAHPGLVTCVRGQAQALLQIHWASPRTASPFATQQRWLMAQAALAQFFRSATGAGVLAKRVIEVVLRHDLASRNTAAAFIREMLKYGVARTVAASERPRHRPIEPSPATLAMLHHWLVVHLATLDGLDGGARSAMLASKPEALGSIQPLIADGLLSSRAVREPDGTFSLFTWVNDGGIVMDRLIAGCTDDAADLKRIPTDVMSVSSIAQGLNLSRTQLGRKFVAAEALGSLGWSGARGRSALWVSSGFRHEYHAAQAVKLAIIDAAFTSCFAKAALVPAIRETACA